MTTLLPPTISTPDLFAWLNRAKSSEAEARALDNYLAQHPEAIDSLPFKERMDAELGWMGVWRRLTGELPFLQDS